MRAVAVILSFLMLAVGSHAAVVESPLEAEGDQSAADDGAFTGAVDQPAPEVSSQQPAMPASSGHPDGSKASLEDQASAMQGAERGHAILDGLLQTEFGALNAPGVEGLRMLQQPPPNGTDPGNGTILQGNQTGHHSHTHPFEGDLGLGSIWFARFYGAPRHIMQVESGGEPTTIVGTRNGIVALQDGDVLWAHLIGNEITSLFSVDVHSDGTPEIGYSTLWRAQLPRVGLLDAGGHILWEHVGDRPFVAAAPTGDGDVLAIDLDGNHTRLGGARGEVVWAGDVDLLPDDDVTTLVAENLGHYLATFADVNGDGVQDSISAGLYWYGAPFAVDNVYTVIHAVDGVTGDKLWIHPIGAEPPVLGVATHVLTDLDFLDARGDGSMDISYTGASFRWPGMWLLLVPFAGLAAIGLMHYETYARAVDGSSDDLAELIGGRTLVTPVLQLEAYTHLEHLDLENDGLHEMAVLRQGTVDTVLDGGITRLETYRLPPSHGQGPTDLVLSPKTYPFDDEAVLHAGPGTDGRVVVASVQGLRSGTLVVMTPDFDIAHEINTSQRPLVAAIDGPLVVSGQDGGVVGLEEGTRTFSEPLRGHPVAVQAADRDGDGFLDAFVLGEDARIHVLDGVTGRVIDTIDLELAVRDIWVKQIDGEASLFILRDAADTGRALERWSGTNLTRQWSVPFTLGQVAWFDGDGDGVPDVATEFDWFDGELKVVSGATGHTMWTADLDNAVSSINALFVADMTSRAGEDLIVHDYSGGFAGYNGATGAEMWRYDQEGFGNACAAGVGPEGSQRLAAVIRAYPDAEMVEIDAQGEAESVPILPASDVYECQMTRVGSDLLVEAVFHDGERPQAGFARHGSERWSSFTPAFFSEFGAVRVLGADPGTDRIYVGTEDHVKALKWSNGDYVGEFVANGPFVQAGAAMDADQDGVMELATITGDGTVWLLSEDVENTTQRLEEIAVAQGKAPPPTDDLDSTDGKKRSPGLAATALLGAIAAIAVARRRQS